MLQVAQISGCCGTHRCCPCEEPEKLERGPHGAPPRAARVHELRGPPRSTPTALRCPRICTSHAADVARPPRGPPDQRNVRPVWRPDTAAFASSMAASRPGQSTKSVRSTAAARAPPSPGARRQQSGETDGSPLWPSCPSPAVCPSEPVGSCGAHAHQTCVREPRGAHQKDEIKHCPLRDFPGILLVRAFADKRHIHELAVDCS